MIEAILRRIWVLLGEVHHLELPLETLTEQRWHEAPLTGVKMPIVFALEGDFAVQIWDTDTLETVGALAQAVARQMQREAASTEA